MCRRVWKLQSIFGLCVGTWQREAMGDMAYRLENGIKRLQYSDGDTEEKITGFTLVQFTQSCEIINICIKSFLEKEITPTSKD